jgi:hypothetical protein
MKHIINDDHDNFIMLIDFDKTKQRHQPLNKHNTKSKNIYKKQVSVDS